jgi:ABC-type proline/glycine betaine transport system permease subunit
MVGLNQCLLFSFVFSIIAARTTTMPRSDETIPEFFDDEQNVYCLIVGFAIILASVIIAIVIFRVKSRSAAFEGSLFQNLEEED